MRREDDQMRQLLTSATLAMALLVSIAGGALAGQPVKTTIWLDGVQVRTILPPAASPQEGTDPFYMVPGTGGVAAVGPGSAGYHGGHWQVYTVSWNVAPYPLTSVGAISTAGAAGDISITRAADLDFLCPIQP
jgi:hypothetical protein